MKCIISDTTATLLISCSDQAGINAAVANFLVIHNANIISLDQYATSEEGGKFFLRLEFCTSKLDTSKKELLKLFQDEVADKFKMDWKINYSSHRKNIAILVSKYDHALLELLWRHNRCELSCNITKIISNHPDMQSVAEHFNIPFFHIPANKDNKREAEDKLLELCIDDDCIVLARYMQILTSKVIDKFKHRIINIHHSFLPAFKGAKPYHQAFEKGVKLAGATAHYVTEDLDMGPIIEQDVMRVSHRFNSKNLQELGKDVERSVLARAVKWHIEDRIIVDGNKTIVFNEA